MSSRGKKKTTMAKLNREARLRERRSEKKARKDARRDAVAHPPQHDDAPPGAHDARHLLKALREIGEVARAKADRRGIERIVGVRQLERIAPLEARPHAARARRCGLCSRAREHPLGEVAADHLAVRSDSARQLEREVARASGDVEHPVARTDTRELGRASTPAVVQTSRHRRVQQVVDTRYAVEHRADLRSLEATR